MIYITGDTHGNLSRINKMPCKEGDVIIICGDFGVIWSRDKLSEINEEKQKLIAKNSKCDILFVDGNHENFNRIEKLPTTEKYGAEVGVYSENIFHLKRGNVYTIEGKKFFVFGGGFSIDKSWRVPFISWWEQELPNYAEYKNGLDNIEKYDGKFDYILTHDAPSSIYGPLRVLFDIIKTPDHSLPNYLEEVKFKSEFKHWYFGHFHIEHTFDEKFTCLYENYVAIE